VKFVSNHSIRHGLLSHLKMIHPMKKLLFVPVFLMLLPLTLYGQILDGPQRDEEADVRDLSTRERLFVGGFVGLQFGTFTAVSLNMHAGYRLTNRISAGLGGMYQYSHERWFGDPIHSHVYGGSLFARLRVVSQAFIHAEHEWLSVQSRSFVEGAGPEARDRARTTERNMLLGAGYGFRMGPRVRLNVMVLYNFNEASAVYYDNPFFKAGIDVSL